MDEIVLKTFFNAMQNNGNSTEQHPINELAISVKLALNCSNSCPLMEIVKYKKSQQQFWEVNSKTLQFKGKLANARINSRHWLLMVNYHEHFIFEFCFPT